MALLLAQILTVYSGIIIVRVLLSWVIPDRSHPLVNLLDRITEPTLAPLRALVPPRIFGGLDLSPIFALLLISVARQALLRMAL